MKDTTILVIDDEPSNIQIIFNLLQQSETSFKLLSSSSSKLGIEIAISTKPDIILTDWQMPEFSGIDVIIALQENEETKNIPIIIATGVNMESSDLKLALDSGAFDFIRKPLDQIELVARINSAVRLSSYIKEKIDNEKTIDKLKANQAQAEIESTKREIMAKTLLLIKISQLNQQFYEKLTCIDRSSCNLDCQFFGIAKNHTKEIIEQGGSQLWRELELNFEQINEGFYKNLNNQFSNLTQNEKKLCAYLRLNLSTKEIASITSQTTRSIEIARTRLREKLGIKGTEDDLHSSLLRF